MTRGNPQRGGFRLDPRRADARHVQHQASRAATRDPRVDALVQQYLPLVQHAVNSISARVPRQVSWDDLVSAGMLGLAEAARSFDPNRGVPFDGYASTRIRGALLDELRSLDWASRSVRTKARLVEERSNALAVQLGRQPTVPELAAHLALEPAEVQRVFDDVSRASLVHYDAASVSENAEDVLPASSSSSPIDELLDREKRGYLKAAVAALPERLRVVVEGYFFEERLMQDIADELGVTQSRVSQMRSEALALLRDGMNSQLDPELVTPVSPESPVARRKAAYYAAVAANSDFRSRLDVDVTDDADVPLAPPIPIRSIRSA
jgi:RNA polymerase sigma factor for flagellar operon FliA